MRERRLCRSHAAESSSPHTVHVARTNRHHVAHRRTRASAASRPDSAVDLPSGCDSYSAAMDLEFSGNIWYSKGPAPWYFVTVPEDESLDLELGDNVAVRLTTRV